MARSDPVERWILRWRTPELVEFSDQINVLHRRFFVPTLLGNIVDGVSPVQL